MVNVMRGSRFDAGRTFDPRRPAPKNLKRLPFETQARRIEAPINVRISAGNRHPFENVPLTAYLQVSTPQGDRFLRAADLLVEGRFNSKGSAVADADVKALEIVTQGGIVLADPSILDGKTPAEVDEYLIQVDILHAAVASCCPQYVFPQTLDVKGQTYKRIMIGELTEIEAAQFLKPEEISGNNADKLRSRLKNPSGEALVYTNEGDANRYIQAANSQGRKFRFMTNAEFDALPAKVKSQLKDDNWFLVEISRGSNSFYWRSLLYAHQNNFNPGFRFNHDAVRLVED